MTPGSSAAPRAAASGSSRRSPGGLGWAAVAGLLLLLLLVPGAASHAYLTSSSPPPGGSVPEGITVLALRFTEQLDPSEVEIALVGPNATQQAAVPEVPPSRPTDVRIETDPLSPGPYQLAWRVLSVDGHVEQGAMAFHVGPGEPAGAVLVDTSGQPPSLLDGVEGAARALVWAGILSAVGLPLFLSEVHRPATVPSRIPRVLALLLVASLVGITALLWLLRRALEADWGAALSTRPGTLLLLQGALVALALAAALAATRRPADQRGRILLVAVLPAALAVVINSMGGHGVVAFASKEAVAGHIAATVHVLVVGLWVGGVLGFLLLGDLEGPKLAELVERFFPVGVLSVVVLAATGLYQAYVHLPRPSALWESPYGWLLLAKTGLLATLVGFGAVHQRWIRPRLERGAFPTGRFGRVIRSELTVLGTVVLLAGVLAAAPLPSAPLDDGPGPPATFEQEAVTEDFRVRIAFEQATIETGKDHELTLELRPRTSLGADQVEATLVLTAPGPNGSERTVEPERTGTSTWRAQPMTFEQPGTWTLAVNLDTPAGEQTALFSVPVNRTG